MSKLIGPLQLYNLSDLLIKVIPSTDWNINLVGENNILASENQDKSLLH
ncbi:hypothetical protein [uncultured Gammaproteobacteria bacterium]|jgi:hypothetical protein|nr:hypothetical protein [uncultured Gammaproteobacteria bacterium]